jgi:NifU-like protein
MWEYTDKVKEHFFNPHNVGVLEDANVVVEVGSAACGDALKLYLKIEDEKVIDAKFQTYGCGSAIASSSVLTDLIKGKSLEEVKKISNEDIVDLLGGLPPAKIHCSVMAQEAVEKALKIYYKEDDDFKIDPDDEIVCLCFKVTRKTIEKTIRKHHLTTFEEVTNYTKAGGACGKCKNKILEIINKNIEKGENKKMTNLEKIEKIKQVIEQDIKPGLQQDGGDIELFDVNDNIVKVKLKGSCSGCPMATLTIKNFVEETLKTKIDKELIVEEIR